MKFFLSCSLFPSALSTGDQIMVTTLAGRAVAGIGAAGLASLNQFRFRSKAHSYQSCGHAPPWDLERRLRRRACLCSPG
ncbi:hypothetical protein BKA62DRAFT_697870 [Auriculariales sp. MPI-PUGE-AT-0066]|nr:hypothetical protein BKA62DRAFT_697870 [Auriculariales sp. MPI-PUGE-AT-0066]